MSCSAVTQTLLFTIVGALAGSGAGLWLVELRNWWEYR